MKILTAITAFTILYYIGLSITNDKPCDHRHLLTSLLNNKWTSAGRRPMTLPVKASKNHSTLLLILILSGDIELNSGPRTKQHSKWYLRRIDTDTEGYAVIPHETQAWYKI